MRVSDQSINRLAVLKAIRRHGPIARTDLPALTGLSGFTITKVTADLVGRGLISERKQDARASTGRPRTYLSIEASGGIVVAASVGGPEGLTVAFVDLMGNRLYGTAGQLGASSSLRDFVDNVAAALRNAIDRSPYDTSAISRVGIALPALTDNVRGAVHYMVTLGEGEVPFADIVADAVGVPVTIENDMVCMARAEHWFGHARQLDTFALIHVGYAVGSADYADGLPRLGAHGYTSELGHVKVDRGPDAARCFCGGFGCLSTFSSMFGIARRFRTRAAPLSSLQAIDAAFDQFLDKVSAGDEIATRIMDAAVARLGVAIANHATTTDPGHVLVLVSRARLKPFLDDRLLPIIAANTLPGMFARTGFTIEVANEDWRWKGAAALALERTYLDENRPSHVATTASQSGPGTSAQAG